MKVPCIWLFLKYCEKLKKFDELYRNLSKTIAIKRMIYSVESVRF